MELDRFELTVISDGTFRLDGGAMFGSIPKPLWEKTDPADDRNRILLGLNTLLVRTPDDSILIETGLGSNYDEKFAYLYAVDKNETDLHRGLAGRGLDRADVTKVVLTHLHFDHCGGNCIHDKNGDLVPAFPGAQYFADRNEFAYAQAPDPRSRSSYLPWTWESVQTSGQLKLTAATEEIADGVEVVPTPGHTAHHKSVIIRSGDKIACFLGDLVPTPSHLKTHYVMGFDLFPRDTMRNKEVMLKRAVEEEWLLIFAHGARVVMGRLTRNLELIPTD